MMRLLLVADLFGLAALVVCMPVRCEFCLSRCFVGVMCLCWCFLVVGFTCY